MICRAIWISSRSQEWIDKLILNQFSLNKETKIVSLVRSSIKSSDLWNNCSILIMLNQIKMIRSSKILILGKELLSTMHLTDSSRNWNKETISKQAISAIIITKFNLMKIKWARRKAIEELNKPNSMPLLLLRWKKIKKGISKKK